MIELCVVEAVQKVDGPGPRGGDADPHLAGELGVTAGHEGRHLLVADLDELGIAAGAVEGAQKGVDAVPRVAIDSVNAPLGQPLEDVISDQFRHRSVLSPGFGSCPLARPSRYEVFARPSSGETRRPST